MSQSAAHILLVAVLERLKVARDATAERAALSVLRTT